MTIEPVGKKVGEGRLGLPLDNPAIADALRRGNVADVHKILAEYGLVQADYEEFAASRYADLMRLIQPDQLYASGSESPPPDIENDFYVQTPENALTDEDRAYVSNALGGKAMKGSKAVESADGGALEQSPSLDRMQGHYDGAGTLLDTLMPKIVEMQFTQQLQAKTDELQKELDKLVAMIRSGEIEDPTVLILALAKFNVERNGLMFAQLGQRYMSQVEKSNTAFDAWKKTPADQFTSAAIQAQQDIKSTSQSMQFLINDMQKVVQHVETTIQWAKSSIDSIKNTKDEIIRKLAAGG